MINKLLNIVNRSLVKKSQAKTIKFTYRFAIRILQILLVSVAVIFIFIPYHAQAADETINIYFFEAKGCPHCKDEEKFLDEIVKKYPQVKINDYEVTQNKYNADLLKKIGNSMEFDVTGVPVTVVGKYHIIGWQNKEITGVELENDIKCAIDKGCSDVVEGIISNGGAGASPQIYGSGYFKLPFMGRTNLKALSLPVLTIVLGLVDGFNPCAMWTLLFLISLLLSMKNRTRMWILGLAFVISSGIVYFAAMAAWLKAITFLEYISFIRYGIGILSLIIGVANLRSYFGGKEECKIEQPGRRQKIMQVLSNIAQKPQFWVALIGIIILAGAVNLLEMICSAGVPAIYTQMLALNNLPKWQYYLYILLYVFFYMLDDLIVLIIAMITLRQTALSTKYSRYVKLAGGIIILLIGILMIFKPDWLLF